MAETNFAPSRTRRTDVQIGLVLVDQRTADQRRVVYADDHVVIVRDESNATTLIDRDSFEAELGTRYRPSRDADPAIDAGQYDSLRDRLAEYDRQDGRKARHKADALREALDLLAGDAPARGGGDDDQPTEGDEAGEDEPTDDEAAVPYEDIPGIGPETAGKLRIQGFVTEADVRAASDGALLAVAGVGPTNLANIREFLD